MYAILLHYHVPLERIDELKDEHLRHIDDQVEDGLFVLGGRLVPRTGGFILANTDDRERVTKALDADPFMRSGSATYELHEFVPTKAGSGVQSALGFTLP